MYPNATLVHAFHARCHLLLVTSRASFYSIVFYSIIIRTEKMVEVLVVSSEYLVVMDGVELGRFQALIDASVFALKMLHDGPASSVTLCSGLVVS